jgi:hypothetical protein
MVRYVKDARFKSGYRKIPSQGGCLSVVVGLIIFVALVKMCSGDKSESTKTETQAKTTVTHPNKQDNENIPTTTPTENLIETADSIQGVSSDTISQTTEQAIIADTVTTTDNKKKKGFFKRLFGKKDE